MRKKRIEIVKFFFIFFAKMELFSKKGFQYYSFFVLNGKASDRLLKIEVIFNF